MKKQEKNNVIEKNSLIEDINVLLKISSKEYLQYIYELVKTLTN